MPKTDRQVSNYGSFSLSFVMSLDLDVVVIPPHSSDGNVTRVFVVGMVIMNKVREDREVSKYWLNIPSSLELESSIILIFNLLFI